MKNLLFMIVIMFSLSFSMVSQTITDDCKEQEASLAWVSEQVIIELDGLIINTEVSDNYLAMIMVKLSEYTSFDIIKIKVKRYLGQYSDLILTQTWTANKNEEGTLYYNIFYSYKSKGFIMLSYYPEVNVIIAAYTTAKIICK